MHDEYIRQPHHLSNSFNDALESINLPIKIYNSLSIKTVANYRPRYRSSGLDFC